MIRNIVFDMGMVLLNWNPMQPCLRYAKDEEMAKKLCSAIFTHPEWGPMNDGGVMLEKDYFVRCRERMESDELKQLGVAVEKDWWLDALYPMQGMDKVIETLLEKGFRLYILTNCGHRFHDFSYKIPHYNRFSGVLVSAEELMLKPDAEIYHRLFEKFDLKAEECIFIDDLQKNIDGAKAVGMEGYCFADGNAEKLLSHLLTMNA
jgi:putative hydrolase of the HAD superfamily